MADAASNDAVHKESLITLPEKADAPQLQRKNGNELVMQVKVQSPHRVFFDEKAVSISGENAAGPFDILPHHHNFIALLDPCEIAIRRPGGRPEQRIKISGGLMHVKSDQVVLFLDV
jgi:F0F1-type ATP synthase epsilon subunit